ncbi:MAG: cytochrome c oxidase assembly protein [Thermoleophilaceae bacterium]
MIEHPDLHWNLSPVLLLAIATYAGIYAWRFRAARREQRDRLPSGGRSIRGRVRGAGWPQAVAFAGGIAALLVAVASPLDGLGEEYLFSAHMVQHILLSDIAPLLLLLGLSRVIMRPATRRLQSVERALGPLAHPGTGLVLWLGLVYLWHVPALYDGALRSPALHGLEHLCFTAAGVAVWWPLIQPVPMRRRLTGLWTFAYIASAKAGLAALGLYLVWSTTVAYPYYEAVPRIWGLSAIEDQNAGGAIMMVEQSIVLVLVFFALFGRMLRQSEEDELRRERLEDAATA